MSYAQKKLQKVVQDNRYTVALEHTGKTINAQWVLRFCDKFIVADTELNNILLQAIFHSDERQLNLLGGK